MRAQRYHWILCLALFGSLTGFRTSPGLAAGQKTNAGDAARTVKLKVDAAIFDLTLKKLGSLKPGTSLEVLEQIKDRNGESWLKVLSDRGIGYVRASKTDYSDHASQTPSDTAAASGSGKFALPVNPAAVLHVGLQVIQSVGQSAPGDNVAVSPYGLWSNARLWLAGARGRTRERLIQRLQFDQESRQSLSSDAFVTADRILKRPELKLQPDFAQFAARSRVSVADSTFDEQSRTDLNAWISERSRGRINNFYSREQWDADARLILLNVCTLDAKWKEPFDDQQTAEAPFYTASGGEQSVQMMVQQSELAWLQTDFCSGVLLPYRERDLTAAILLPAEGSSLDQLVKQLAEAQLQEQLRGAEQQQVLLLLPKFEITSRLDLFEALDIQSSQTGEADFSGISEQQVQISSVQQQVSLVVDADGTTAAAATATQLGTSSVGKTRPRILQCNRPFLFVVLHKPTLTPLFLSAVKHPITPGNGQRSAK